ncbi:MAG: hypothetical protein ACI9KD_002400 [Congregibacter sp.]|jgi:hypothetical protein
MNTFRFLGFILIASLAPLAHAASKYQDLLRLFETSVWTVLRQWAMAFPTTLQRG